MWCVIYCSCFERNKCVIVIRLAKHFQRLQGISCIRCTHSLNQAVLHAAILTCDRKAILSLDRGQFHRSEQAPMLTKRCPDSGSRTCLYIMRAARASTFGREFAGQDNTNAEVHESLGYPLSAWSDLNWDPDCGLEKSGKRIYVYTSRMPCWSACHRSAVIKRPKFVVKLLQ